MGCAKKLVVFADMAMSGRVFRAADLGGVFWLEAIKGQA